MKIEEKAANSDMYATKVRDLVENLRNLEDNQVILAQSLEELRKRLKPILRSGMYDEESVVESPESFSELSGTVVRLTSFIISETLTVNKVLKYLDL